MANGITSSRRGDRQHAPGPTQRHISQPRFPKDKFRRIGAPYRAPPAQGYGTRQRTGGPPGQIVGDGSGAELSQCGLWSDQLSLGISRKWMSVLTMMPCNVMTAMSTTCSDLGRS
jgi:hypothetical protein